MITPNTNAGALRPERKPAAWIPSLFFAAGFPFYVITFVAAIMYKRLGVSNTDIAMYTSLLFLPWVIKPLWSPLLDLTKTKRYWIYSMEFLAGCAFAGIAFTIPLPDFFQFTLAFLWFAAFVSATHEASADGFYICALDEKRRSSMLGLRLSFYRGGIILAQSAILIFAGFLEGKISIEPAEFKVVAAEYSNSSSLIKFDTLAPRPMPGSLRVIAEPSRLEIPAVPVQSDDINTYAAFARNLNIMNGFSRTAQGEITEQYVPSGDGNYGTVWLHLSKPPEKNREYTLAVDAAGGDERIRIIEGKNIRFNRNNWNRPAIVVLHVPAGINKNSEVVFKVQSEKSSMVWIIIFGIIGGLFFILSVYHKIVLPDPLSDNAGRLGEERSFLKEYFRTVFRFFEKKKVGLAILFLLFFRFGEAQHIKIAPLFWGESRELGGLGLSNAIIGVLGGAGLIPYILGALLGAYAIHKKGLRFWLWPMFAAINITPLIYAYLAYFQPQMPWIVYACVGAEQLFTGFGITAYFMFMINLSDGEYNASYFAFAAAFMALGQMIPGMISGMIQEAVGYRYFFIWLAASAIPAAFIIKRLKRRILYIG